ncbi:LytTR family DNA-binding domain-containing protein [Zobellia sp. 1_MG-2023]|uniref:LytR/AlgR family response regulator transcription factor n=1 Tax=Zobellia sp. 1_MG-2023 TaxID=3062626 RepID=UPI0026E1AFF2|nr:LytTR family DNA-binding domain-containing protein [Zobellia sp. 1_MG-2023]MDO6819430.1 LytTR family DNA-binding domain-containing protein [Zobellia sp. 1_MG-2023]
MENLKLTCAIIEDSPAHAKQLEKLIHQHTSLKFKKTYRNAIEAKNHRANENVDLLFLTVELPLITGFDLIESFKKSPQIILVSSKPDYAFRAFDYEVTDYLLKPILSSRFNKSIEKALRNSKLTAILQDEAHFFVKSNSRKVKINYKDIKWIEALGDYVKLVTEKSNHIVLSSMKAFEGKLPTSQFVRIHKSYIINLKRIEKFNNTMVEVEGKKITLSRSRRDSFMNAIGTS